MTKKVLLTGADGFLGNNIVRELLNRGYEIRAFIEPTRQPKTLEDLPNITFFRGDLLNPADVTHATEGCSLIIHAAANTTIVPARSEIIRRVNLDGTLNIIQAALQNEVERLVFIGTANTFSFGSKENPGHEGTPYSGAQYGLDYMDSKYEAYLALMKAVKEDKLPAVVVNPTFMLGPYDVKPSSGAMIVNLYQGKVPGYTNGGRNYIYVKDAACGVVNALEKGKVGESYILGNQNLSYKEAFTLIANTIGVPPPKIYFPAFVTKAFALILTFFAKLRGTLPNISFPMAQIACDEHYFTAAKAVREIDLPQTPLSIAIKESYEWLRDNGYLTKD
ncbi:MAG: NAD-dependent epimerase/dehydratase family protein [Saprospiraceae bacterium]|nr:NAD-dependent epimerase/dehydratase family protein [Saprospiraceae bacterium]